MACEVASISRFAKFERKLYTPDGNLHTEYRPDIFFNIGVHLPRRARLVTKKMQLDVGNEPYLSIQYSNNTIHIC